MRKRTGNLSIKNIITVIFTLALFISMTGYGILIFAGWILSARETALHMASDINQEIYDQVSSFMQTPFHLNEVNHKIIENGMLDLTDERQRDRFFVEVLESHKGSIYSFSYGTANGEYYGARRNENGAVEIMRNNAATGGNSWYYSVKEDLTAGDIAVKAGKFDPRTRAWYKAAVETGDFIFSPLYKHFIMDDLTVSAAWPVYNASGTLEGVIGTHMLLADISTYINDKAEEQNGIAFIIERDSKLLIANSMNEANFSVLQDGTMERYSLKDIDEKYQQIYKQKNSDYFVNTKEIHMPGIDWIVISAIPKSLFMADVYESMILASVIAVLSLLLSVFIYNMFMKKYLKPMKNLLQISDEISSGDLSKRVDIIRNDEIGLISGSFNNVADKMQSMVDNLENLVKERTKELEEVNLYLEKSREDLRLILDSAAEAIYGIDMKGNCTFCNKSCISILGFHNEGELLGRNMHKLIHHTHKDGTPFSGDDCRIIEAIQNGEGTHVDDEVFWRADGSSFDVEYFSYPQISNGEIIGAVITFMDVSERKRREAEIEYLNCYDTLTGLHNRRCFEENRGRIDTRDSLPLSVIFADINGLKMTNDIFGHTAGDDLIRKSSEIIKQACRSSDIVARVGGDEFIILMPKTEKDDAGKIIDRIRSGFSNARIEAIKCSVALGLDTKYNTEQPLDEIIANAENAMYREKTMNRKFINADIIDTIIDTLHTRSPRERQHSVNVSRSCSEIGSAMGLNTSEVNKLVRAGYLHDIGKIVIDDDVLNKAELSGDEYEKMQQHSAVGYRILSLFDDTLDLAEYVYGHHERWDGEGYPRGLSGEQIPLLSRIISVAETYDRVMNGNGSDMEERVQAAADVLAEGSGRQFDPKIVDIFSRIITDRRITGNKDER